MSDKVRAKGENPPPKQQINAFLKTIRKNKRKKIPYCLNKPKPSNQREDQPIVEATTSKKTSLERNKRKRKEQEEPAKKRSKKFN